MKSHLRLLTLGTAETHHPPDDPIAQAIMAEPIGGRPVQILVGEQRHLMHHWTMAERGDDRLHVAWERRDDLPHLHEPLWWRIRTAAHRVWNT